MKVDDPAWDRLLAAARRKLEKSAGRLDGSVGLTQPTDAERRIIIGATGQYRSAEVKTLRVDLVELDDALHDACGRGLLAVLAERDGPVRDRAAERADEAEARESALAQARRLCRHRAEPWFTMWLDAVGSDGTATRLVRRGEADVLGWAARVLDRLPATNLPLPALAEWATGNTKALTGTPLSAVVLRALAIRDGAAAPANRAEARARWESAGVIVDDLASQVLVLNLRAREDHIVANWLGDAAGFGVPFRLTLHQLNIDPLTPVARDIYVCENPAVLRAAAGELGANSATLVCTEGQPSAACHALLARATGTIHWRGDFDWTGLRTTATAIARHTARPWRMTTQEYLAALETGDSETLKGPPATSPWEPRLAEALTEHRRAIMEERLIPQLLNDLT
ncbi:MAG: TIGR02679 family protein [Actinophytocola sp.]|uniref:TIGR02679 family protein n=1 Tax=Actinophytocola sp. TaxID=1872138 RepID=UPI001329D0E8|nr:TIGR02679 family protein [Actinophytocola sp.]MPZ80535.1 TIGR02679 family protein [Actinophytocola sp.]